MTLPIFLACLFALLFLLAMAWNTRIDVQWSLAIQERDDAEAKAAELQEALAVALTGLNKANLFLQEIEKKERIKFMTKAYRENHADEIERALRKRDINDIEKGLGG